MAQYIKNDINPPFFYEKQYFRQAWILIIILLINAIWVLDFGYRIFYDIPLGDKPMPITGLIVFAVICVGLSTLLITAKLETEIRKEGIYIRFTPFHLSKKFFEWENIENYQVDEYKPLREFGGWGIRYSLSGAGTAYNVVGNKGLKLTLKNGKKVVI